MPITLPPISRRRFLSASVAAGASLLARPGMSRVAEDVDLNRFVLLSDTHIPGNKEYLHQNRVRPWDNMQQITREVLALSPRPSAVLISGDCACLKGLPEDYVSLVEALNPLRESGLPVHLALGNHDHRENFWKALPPDAACPQEIADRHISLISTPLANWFLLDSLDVTDRTPGVLGEEQLVWLGRALDAHRDKPALVVFHHNPDEKPGTTGLTDTRAIFEVLLPRQQVKACIFGHTHVWRYTQRDRLHLINLPATAWTFAQQEPNGWVEANLRRDGATFRLHALKANHPQQRQLLDVAWR